MPFVYDEIDKTMLVTNVPAEELRTQGERFSTEDILKAIDALKPLALKYALMIVGYDKLYLDELLHLEELARKALAERKEQRAGEKVGLRRAEAEIIRQAKWLIREAIATIDNAILTRPKVEGETGEDRRSATTKLKAELKGVRGPLGADPTAIETKLRSSKTMLESAALKARVLELQGDDRNIAGDIDKMITRITTTTQGKKGAQETAKTATGDLDILDGLIYENLKALTRAGRAYYGARGDRVMVSQFNLDVLRQRNTTTGSIDQPPPPPDPVAPTRGTEAPTGGTDSPPK